MTFDPYETFMGTFIEDRRTPVKVSMMKMKELRAPYFRDEKMKCTVVELNYKGNGKAMFILPDQGKMKQVEDGLDERTLRNWLKMFTKRYSLGHLGATSFYPC